MTRVFVGLIVAAAIVLVFHHQGGAGGFSDWRCGSRIISVGMSQGDVLALCGDPDSSRSWQEVYESDPIRQNLGLYRQLITVTFEVWTYNPGPGRFLRFLTFKDGILMNIETGGYGY
jgi:hypothetical protein